MELQQPPQEPPELQLKRQEMEMADALAREKMERELELKAAEIEADKAIRMQEMQMEFQLRQQMAERGSPISANLPRL